MPSIGSIELAPSGTAAPKRAQTTSDPAGCALVGRNAAGKDDVIKASIHTLRENHCRAHRKSASPMCGGPTKASYLTTGRPPKGLFP
jgi:hypothetical protein